MYSLVRVMKQVDQVNQEIDLVLKRNMKSYIRIPYF